MPFPMKVQPFDPGSPAKAPGSGNLAVVALKPLPQKSRLKRLLERQFRAGPVVPAAAAPPTVPDAERVPPPGDVRDKDNIEVGANTSGEREPSSLCLSKMVQNFLEGNNDKPARCGRRRCSCFNGSCDDSSDDEFDSYGELCAPASSEVSEIVKSLVSSAGVCERNLLAEVCKILERTRVRSDKDDACWRRSFVVNGLVALGFDASVCKSRWEKSPSVPDGEYEYIDVFLEGVVVGETDRRVLIDIDFRSEFEIARSTKRYRSVLQSLPTVFVGKADRLQQIVAVVSEAARQSLKKRGLHVPPWRKSDYMKAKWLSPYQRTSTAATADSAASTNLICNTRPPHEEESRTETMPNADGVGNVVVAVPKPGSTDRDMLLTKPSELVGFVPAALGHEESSEKPAGCGGLAVRVVNLETTTPASEWQPPAVTPKAPTPRGAKVVTGLTSMILAEKENVDG